MALCVTTKQHGQGLLDKRRAVMQGRLELDCIPGGRLFPASSEGQWSVTQMLREEPDHASAPVKVTEYCGGGITSDMIPPPKLQAVK